MRVLITGGSHSELPLIKSMRDKGHYVISTGNNADGPGHRAASKYVMGDFSDKDFITHLAQSEKVDAIVSGCNDFAYLSAAYACEKLGLKGHDSYETACTVHSKDRFRSFTRSVGIRTPQVREIHSEEEAEEVIDSLGLPAVIKPVDLTGGKGVKICRSREEAREACRAALAATRADRIIAEEFISGESYGTSVLLKNHKAAAYVIGCELYYINKYLVSGACTAGDFPKEAEAALIGDIEKISAGLGLCDGLFHTQFVLGEDNVPVIIDPCRRAPGDLYVKFAEYVTGVDFAGAITAAEMGLEIPDRFECGRKNAARMCIMTDRNGIVEGIDIDPTLEEKIFDKLIWGGRGDVIEDFTKYKAGIVFFGCESFGELKEYYSNFHALARINVSGRA